MRSADDVLRQVRVAYERGRVSRAMRTPAMVLPMVLASFAGCGRPVTSIMMGCVLASVVGLLVWRGGSAGRAVSPGLVAGLVSLVVPLVSSRTFEHLGIDGALQLAVCVLGGLGSGVIVSRFAMREREERTLFVVVGGGIAALVGALGCLSAGFGGVVAMTIGLLVIAPLALRDVVGRS